MARRVVLIGPKREAKAKSTCPALQMSPLDADALINEGSVRVEVAYRGGKLRDALTLAMTDDYVTRRGQGDPQKAWWHLAEFLRKMHGITELDVETPIPFH